MIRPGPDTLNYNTNGYATGEDLVHISHTHVSGTGGSGRYGNIGIVPMIEMPHRRSISFHHENEIARCGYYATTLIPKQDLREMANTRQVRLEVTAANRCAIHRWTWGEGTEPWIRIDLGASIAGDSLGGFAKWVDSATLLCKAEVKGGWGHEIPWTVYPKSGS
jgi:putative alpha-1,2-mannosidase